jgi:hypothetical protein
MHKYWHFKDIGFSTDGTPLEDADPVNALTQIKLLTAGLAPSNPATCRAVQCPSPKANLLGPKS